MSKKEILFKKLKESIIEGLLEEAVEYLKLVIELEVPPKEILDDVIIKAAEEVGLRYESKEFFLADMLLAGDVINECLDLVRPILKKDAAESLGVIMIGTPEGDIHDIGKTLIISMLQGQNFDVIDLGVDVPSATFVEKAINYNPDIIGISGLLTVTISKMREVVVDLKKAGINSKIILGGGILSEDTCRAEGADEWTKDAWEGVNKIKGMLKED